MLFKRYFVLTLQATFKATNWFQDLKGTLIVLKHFILSNWRVGVPGLFRTLRQLSKSSSKFLVSPSVDNRIADGVQASCQVEYNELSILSLWRHAKKTEACHDQQRNDTEKADGYNNGECAGAFHFALDGSHSWNVTQFSGLFSVLLGHNKGVAVRERDDHQRYDHQWYHQEDEIAFGWRSQVLMS